MVRLAEEAGAGVNVKKYLPGVPEITREGLAVVAGAFLAAGFFALMPKARKWIADRLPTAGK